MTILRNFLKKLMIFGQDQKEKNNDKTKIIKSSGVHARKNRFLIIVNVLGSSGPIKFVVKEDDSVAAVIGTALKLYAQEERLPVLGYDVNNCLLYPSNGEHDALSPNEIIAASGGRNFLLWKKQSHQKWQMMTVTAQTKKTSCWKTCLKFRGGPNIFYRPG